VSDRKQGCSLGCLYGSHYTLHMPTAPHRPCPPTGEAGQPGSLSEDTTRWVVGMSREDAEGVAAARFPGRNISLSQDEDVLDTWCVCARARVCVHVCICPRMRAHLCAFECVYLQGELIHMCVNLAMHLFTHASSPCRFSSGLFPFSVFNWPDNTQDLKAFYPTR